ncbi:MAG: polymerase, sigma-24 subunit, subfamily [Phenylobacterium sp.]|nr:polymerase, sigma-24 subunit, subfamily [Phenylobacterium sp.]
MSAEPAPADAELARRAAAGEDRAYAELVRRHQDGLYRLLRRYVGSADEAYEATQEAFIAAWSALSRYDPQRPFGAWLRTIAINKARDRTRRALVRRLLFSDRAVDDAQAPQHPAPDPGADAQLVERERTAVLEHAVAQLPAKLRGPLVLTAFDGCSHAEAAAILGVSAKTVEMCVYRARRKLAEALGSAA